MVFQTCLIGSYPDAEARERRSLIGATSKGNGVLFLVHRRELVKQAVDTIYGGNAGRSTRRHSVRLA